MLIRTLLSTGKPPILMTGSVRDQGLPDTNVLILRRLVDPDELPNAMAVSAVTLAELPKGPHQVRTNARRLDVLQRVENEFDPIPFGAEAAPVTRPLVPAEYR